MTTAPHRVRTRPRRHGALAALSVAALALTGCSVADRGGSGDQGSSSAEAKTVTIMTHDSFSLPDELIARFEQESGHTLVTTAPGDAGSVVNQLLLAKDAPTVDGVYGIEDHSAHRLVSEGVIAEHVPADLPDSARDLVVDGRMTPVDQGQVCLNVDTPWFQEQGLAAPTTLEQVAAPEYAELTVVTSPVSSSPGLALLAATVAEFGEDGWQDWWRTALQGGMQVDASWSDAYNTSFSGGEGTGTRPIVLSYSSSPAFAPDTDVVAASCTPQVEYAGVVEGAENPEGARAFVDFLLTEDVQAAIPDAMYMYPVDSSVPLPEAWAEHAPLVEDPIVPDAGLLDSRREDLLKKWTALHEEAAS